MASTAVVRPSRSYRREYDIDDLANRLRFFRRLVATESGRVVGTGRADVDSPVGTSPRACAG
ncbi:hypothetical protein [Streptomyces caelestis]|jgi:betaine-aldehyde dehydrogenase|uniref:Uncharacterized protein n=1 Tax=Streptomyces caelestis TaxID=36816 RepID=A0A7W9H121_9ACTN|nr:hypothetical protein [Streptomyces caelestis]MBB5793373.1 hypothetical protein [Streptomyces caelestis]GGW55806.1 hypothetical protein GCM10010320_40680 [Streptomyces caelestis]